MTPPKAGKAEDLQSVRGPERKSRAAQGLRASETKAAGSRRTVDLGGLDGRVGYMLRRAQIHIFRDFIQTMAELDIRPAQFSVLTVIDANKELTQRELGQTLGIEPARLVLMLDELERRELSKRSQAPNDRRSKVLSLTPKGKHYLKHLNELARTHEERVLSGLSPDERDQLLRLLGMLFRD